ncbi:helix-turn-helix domain-containing protein [Frigidibacter albus]|uniref:Helix-turn-helix domain-containing protein n=2 Tax=Frigidibacter albus TaxID=1465486 RepID=A0A6L8VFJ7_9RHOB|nr:helix-turn-helix domain-containing protein [Frigidibacter albus]NBE30920.1 helix-turn-helix domain-containing protein [Frigidibacter albus]
MDEGATAGWFSDETATFGDRVTGAREAAGMTREQLSARLGVKLKTVAAWEDDMSDPRGNKLQMLSGMLGVSIPWLLTGQGDGPEGPDAQRNELAPLLAEMRQLQADLGQIAGRMGQLEQRLRAATGSAAQQEMTE